MKVADLQQHLADLGRLLEASGARTVAADLAAIHDGLAPFRELPLKGFAEFLTRAEAYRRGGEVPIRPPKGGSGRRGPETGARKPGPPDVEALAREARDLYERAADPSVTEGKVEDLARRLGGLAKDGLVTVAEATGLKGMKSKKKDDILGVIRQRILSRKGSSQRVGLIDRPAPTSPGAAPLPSAELVGTGE
jgi:hypothetical protein